MILDSLSIARAEFARRTGWEIKPEGACKDDVCIPLPEKFGDPFDVRALAAHLQMPLVRDDAAGLWALGPASGGRALIKAHAPALELPDWRGNNFSLDSLRGNKVLLVAWASW